EGCRPDLHPVGRGFGRLSGMAGPCPDPGARQARGGASRIQRRNCHRPPGLADRRRLGWAASTGRRRACRLRGGPADRHLGIRHTAARRVRSFDPLPGAACGACLYRGPPSLQRNGGPRTIDRVKRDPRIVTDAAASRQTPGPGPRSDGLPNREKLAPSADQLPLDLARRIVELAEDKKAADIVLLDLAGLTTLADYFVICSGGSERQIEAIADGIIEGMRAERVRPIGREGTAASHWVLVDFGSVVVHIFTPPERDYYSLEKHWSEARVVVRVQ